MLIVGGCHCKNIVFELDWPGATLEVAELQSRLARRQRNWIADVRMSEPRL